MALKPLDPEILEQTQAELKQSLQGSVLPMENVENIRGLLNTTEFEWPKGSGTTYSVPRVPYDVGLKIEDLFIRIRESKSHPGALAMLPVYERQVRDAVDIIWGSVVPKRKIDKLKRMLRIGKNPFRRCSEGEVADLIAFFLVRRMTSNVKFHYPAPQTEKSKEQ